MANTGSIANTLILTFSNLPASISGQMADLVDNARIECANFCNVTLGTPVFDDTYKSAVTQLAKANVIDAMSINGGGTYSLEGLSVSNTNLTSAVTSLRADAYNQLQMLGRKSQHMRVLS